jgi:hypothetical protein
VRRSSTLRTHDITLLEGTLVRLVDDDVHEGGTTVAADYSADRADPLFVRAGSEPSRQVDDAEDVLGLGGASAAGALTYAIWPLGKSGFSDWLSVDDTTTSIIVTNTSGGTRPIVLRIRLDAAPAGVTGGDFTYDNAKKVLVVRPTGPSVTVTK